MYDYLAKIILLGPSGCGKSCLLHRFVRNEWRVLNSQTIGVEFSSKIVRVGTERRRIKLQLWDTAGQERFRSLTRGYYRGSAGVLLVYDITNRESFAALTEFIADIRALTSNTVSILVVANKIDLEAAADPTMLVPGKSAAEWSMANGGFPVIYVSALTGENVSEAFEKLASMILTKIELGTIDPENPDSGVQYGDVPRWDSTLPRRGGGKRIAFTGQGMGTWGCC